jgi:hypothetical protein
MESDISSRSRRGDDDDEHEAGQKRKRDDESAETDPLADTTDAQAAKRARGAAAAAAAGGSAGAAATAAGRNGRPSKPCFDFQRFGNCRRGASCFFEHVPRDSQAQSSQQQPQLGHFPLPGQQPQWLPPGGMMSSMQRQQQMMAMQMQQQMQQQQMLMQQQQQPPPQSQTLHTIRVMDDDETEIPLTGRGAHVTAAASHGLLDGGRGGSFMGRGGGRGGRGGLGFIQQRGGGMALPPGSGTFVPFSYANSSAAPAPQQSQQRFVSASSAEMPASSADHTADAERKDVSADASGAAQQAAQQRDNGGGEEAADVGGDEDDGPPILSNEEYMASLAARGTFDRAARGGGRGGARGGARGGGRGGARGGFGGDGGVNGGGGHDHSCKLFLTRVPAELNSLVALAPHFAQFGEIVSIKIVGEDRALVQMGSHAEALAALNSPQAVLGNRFIQVEWARHDGGGGGANVAHGAGQSHQREFKQRQPHFHAPQQFVRAQQQQQQQSDPHSVAPPPPAAPLSAIDVAKALAKTNAASAASSQSESELAASSTPAAAPAASSAEAKMAALKALLLQKQLATQKELLAKLTASNSTLTTVEKQALMKRIAALNDEIKGAKAGASAAAAHKPAAAAAGPATPPAKLSALEVVARMKAAKAAAAAAAAAESQE